MFRFNQGETNLLYDESPCKDASNDSAFVNDQSFAMEECAVKDIRQDALVEYCNRRENDVRSTPASFFENPLATMDFSESNI